MHNLHKEDLETTNEDFSSGFDQHVSDSEVDTQGLQNAASASEEEVEEEEKNSEDSSAQVDDQSDNEDAEETEASLENEEDEEEEEDELAVLKRELEDTRSREKLFKSRLEDLSDQYRTTRDSLEDLRYNAIATKENAPKETPKVEELPESFKELKELLPDVAQAVEELLSQRLTQTQASIDSKVNTYMAPVQEQVAQMHQTTHMSRILAAHPDANDVAGSDEFTSWVDKLPAWEKRSADAVVKGGSSDEVIELLDYYKKANDLRSKVSTTKKTSTEAAKKANEALAKKVRNAQGVKSNRTTPETSAKTDEVDMDDFDAGFSEHLKSLEKTDFWR